MDGKNNIGLRQNTLQLKIKSYHHSRAEMPCSRSSISDATAKHHSKISCLKIKNFPNLKKNFVIFLSMLLLLACQLQFVVPESRDEI